MDSWQIVILAWVGLSPLAAVLFARYVGYEVPKPPAAGVTNASWTAEQANKWIARSANEWLARR